jgi:iron(III) transport system ATP-binding protein
VSAVEARLPLLTVEDLAVSHGAARAIHDLSLRLDERGIVAMVGPVGCGKTTLLRAIAGFERPDAGRVSIEGTEVVGPTRWVPPEQRQVGMVFQQGALFPHLTAWDNVLYGVRRRADAADRATEVLELVGLAELRERYPDQLSGGQQQLVALARALAPSPKLVLLDEPFASLDPALRGRVREQICNVLRRANIAALLVSHDQEEALSVADRVVVMGRGTILQVGTPEEIYHRPATVEVAGFIGGGQLLGYTAAGGRLDCPLGRLATDAPDGAGKLLVRSEDFLLRAEAVAETSGTGATGRVASREFYGHDLIQDVELDSGETIRVRVLVAEGPAVGARVRVGLRDRRFQVYPEGAAATGATASVQKSP